MMPKRIALSSLFVIACTALLGIILLIEVPLFTTLSEGAVVTGNGLGKAAGLASGSVQAIANAGDTIDKADDDASDGEITEAMIKSDFDTICNLELLSTDVTVHYEWKYGDPKSPTYAKMFVLNGTGVFLTDLSAADVSIKNNVVTVTLLEPSLKVYFDGKPESIAEYKGLSNPFEKMETANEGYLNQRSEAIKKVKTEMYGYEGLLDRSKKSAEATIKDIVKSVYGMDAVVNFKGVGEVYEGQ